MADDKLVKAPSALESRMAIVEMRKDKLLAALTPLGLNVDRFLTQVRFAMLRQPALQECDPQSILECAVQAAELGIAPDGTLGSGWMVPFNDRQRGKVATLIPGYRGLIDLAVRSGAVLGIDAVIVHARDGWQYEPKRGDKADFMHTPYSPRIARWEPRGDEVAAFDAEGREIDLDPGPMVRAYAVATLAGGAKQSMVMELRELIARRNRAASYRNSRSAWHDKDIFVRENMFRKIPVRAICNLLPLSPERASLLAKALELDDQDDVVAAEPEPTEQPARRSKVRAAVEAPPPASGVVDSTATAHPPDPEPGSEG